MRHYLQEARGLSRRGVALGGIIALHISVIYMFASGLAIKLLPLPPTEVLATVTQTVRPPETAPNLMPPALTRIVVDPPPDPGFDPPKDDSATTIERIPLVVLTPPQVPVATKEAPPAIRVLGQNRFPNSEDYYPPDLRREGVQGATIVRACVGENGRLSSRPSVEQSSGNSRLDAGAIKVAEAGRYAKSVQGTNPVPNCFRVRVGFQMR